MSGKRCGFIVDNYGVLNVCSHAYLTYICLANSVFPDTASQSATMSMYNALFAMKKSEAHIGFAVNF